MTAPLEHRLTQAQKLRLVLADGKWHTNAELSEGVGLRFGARLLELRRGEDGGFPMEVETESVNESESLWRYRWTGFQAVAVPPKKRSVKARLAEVEAELARANAALEAANRELEKRKPYRAPQVQTYFGPINPEVFKVTS